MRESFERSVTGLETVFLSRGSELTERFGTMGAEITARFAETGSALTEDIAGRGPALRAEIESAGLSVAETIEGRGRDAQAALALAASGAGETLTARAGMVRDELIGTAERIAEALSDRGGPSPTHGRHRGAARRDRHGAGPRIWRPGSPRRPSAPAAASRIAPAGRGEPGGRLHGSGPGFEAGAAAAVGSAGASLRGRRPRGGRRPARPRKSPPPCAVRPDATGAAEARIFEHPRSGREFAAALAARDRRSAEALRAAADQAGEAAEGRTATRLPGLTGALETLRNASAEVTGAVEAETAILTTRFRDAADRAGTELGERGMAAVPPSGPPSTISTWTCRADRRRHRQPRRGRPRDLGRPRREDRRDGDGLRRPWPQRRRLLASHADETQARISGTGRDIVLAVASQGARIADTLSQTGASFAETADGRVRAIDETLGNRLAALQETIARGDILADRIGRDTTAFGETVGARLEEMDRLITGKGQAVAETISAQAREAGSLIETHLGGLEERSVRRTAEIGAAVADLVATSTAIWAPASPRSTRCCAPGPTRWRGSWPRVIAA